MLFRKGDYSNSDYKQRFKEQIEVLEAYNGGGPIWEQPGSHGKGDCRTGTGHGDRRRRGKTANVGEGKIIGDRFLTHLGQASVQRDHPIAQERLRETTEKPPQGPNGHVRADGGL